jgi:hypothetical protein
MAGRPLSIVHPQLLEIARVRPWRLWREMIEDVEAGRITHEELHGRMARMLEQLAE